MNIKEISEKLLSSEATKSLLSENKIKIEFQNEKWNTIHSPYFVDPSSNKLREVDIIGRMFFKKEIKKDIEIGSDIILIIEVKSISNYHIICEGEIPNDHYPKESNHRIWLGYDSYARNKRVIDMLKKTAIKDLNKQKIIKAFQKWMFPDSRSIVGNFSPNIYNDIKRFSAFRETNIGNTKDLDSSVLWKAFLSLNSACEGYELFEWNFIESDFLSSIDYAMAFKKDPLKVLKKSFYEVHMLRHTSIHKVLVVDSMLWTCSNDVSPLEYFRLLQRNVVGHKENWIDIVNINSLKKYVAKITQHYNEFFEKQQMTRVV
jgi:hypothetical protein